MTELDLDSYMVKPEWKEIRGQKKSSLLLMSRTQVPEASCDIQFSWVTDPANPTTHSDEHANNFNEIMLFIGGEAEKPEDLGAEIEFYLGGQRLLFNTSSGIFIPAGVRHGHLSRKKVDGPFVEMSVTLRNRNTTPDPDKKDVAYQRTNEFLRKAFDYEKYLIRKPAYETMTDIKNRQCPTMTFMSAKQVPEAKCYLELGWIYAMPEPASIFEHVHKFEEVLLHWGNNAENPLDLGAEIGFGIDGHPLIFNNTAAAWVPRGRRHGPLVWKQVRRPHVEMAFIIGTGSMKEAWGDSGIGGPDQRQIEE
jgi:hypothetical protein